MALVNMEYVTIPAGDENGVLKWIIGVKLGEREPAIMSSRGNPLVFDSEKEAQEYINDLD